MSAANSTTRQRFRTIKRFRGYRFGRDGTTWSRRPRNGIGPLLKTWRLLAGSINDDGYHIIALASHPYQAHRLILEAFRGPCPKGMQACHNDGDRSNNRVSNLRWDTIKNNHADKMKHGTQQIGSLNPAAKLTPKNVVAIRSRREKGEGGIALANEFKVARNTILNIVSRRNWKHIV